MTWLILKFWCFLLLLSVFIVSFYMFIIIPDKHVFFPEKIYVSLIQCNIDLLQSYKWIISWLGCQKNWAKTLEARVANVSCVWTPDVYNSCRPACLYGTGNSINLWEMHRKSPAFVLQNVIFFCRSVLGFPSATFALSSRYVFSLMSVANPADSVQLAASGPMGFEAWRSGGIS